MALKLPKPPSGVRKHRRKPQRAVGAGSLELPEGVSETEPAADGKAKPVIDIGEEDGRKHLTEVLCSSIADELSARADMEQDWLTWLEQYKRAELEPKTYPWPGASNVNINLTAIYTDTLSAKVLQSLFAANPFWIATPVNKRFEAAAKPLERYLDWLRQYAWDEYHVVKPMVLELIKLGTAVLTNAWVDLPLTRTDERTGELKEVGRTVGPRPSWVPLEDFLIPRGFNAINASEKGIRAPWVGYRQRYTKQHLQMFAHTEFFTDIEPVLKARGDDPTELDRFRDGDGSRSPERGAFDETDIWAVWQVWFSWDLNGDGYPEDYVAYLHPASKTLLRLRPNPYLNGMRPFVSCAFVEQEKQLYGIGVPEMVQSYEDEVTTMHNQRVDNGHIANTIVLAARRGSGITEKMRIYPGKVLQVSDPASDVKKIEFGSNHMLSIQEEQVTTGLAERRVGISDLNLGRESSPLGRAAATTVMQLMQEGSSRKDLQTSDIKRALAEQAVQIIELYQTHGVPPAESPGSPEQILDKPEDAAAVRQILGIQDGIAGVVGLQINTATQSINREAERQADQEMFTLLTTQYYQPLLNVIPMLAQGVPPPIAGLILSMVRGADVFMKRMFNSRQVFDTDSMLLGEQMTAVVQQLSQAAEQAAAAEAQAAQQGLLPPPGAEGQEPAASPA